MMADLAGTTTQFAGTFLTTTAPEPICVLSPIFTPPQNNTVAPNAHMITKHRSFQVLTSNGRILSHQAFFTNTISIHNGTPSMADIEPASDTLRWSKDMQCGSPWQKPRKKQSALTHAVIVKVSKLLKFQKEVNQSHHLSIICVVLS